MKWRASSVLALLCWGYCLSTTTQAADLYRPTPDFLSTAPMESRYAARLGAYAHSVGGWESGSVDISGEFLFPQFPSSFLPPEYRFLVPRPHVGLMANT